MWLVACGTNFATRPYLHSNNDVARKIEDKLDSMLVNRIEHDVCGLSVRMIDDWKLVTIPPEVKQRIERDNGEDL